MECVDGNGGSRLLVTELCLIKELVMQLKVHLGGSPDLCKNLASQIFSLTERSIGMITSTNLNGGRKLSASDAGLASATPSPLSDVSDMPFNTTKKRKMMEKRKHQVRVISAGGGENPVEDGHSWRKYGQKEILGARHPRGYYRCTHRHSQGCPATKQVQRTDEDPTLFDVIYHGAHTCVHKAVPAGAAAAARQPAAATESPEHNPDEDRLLRSLSASLAGGDDGLAAAAEPQSWRAATHFCFSSAPASGCLAPERSPVLAPSTSERWGVSPATSDSNDAATFRPCEFAAGVTDWRAQSEFHEVVSALVAASAPEPAVFSLDELRDIDISSFFA